MDSELRQLERAARQDEDALPAWDVAREQAGLPLSLHGLEVKKRDFEKYISENVLKSLEHTLNLYMDKYDSVVNYVAWNYCSAMDLSWELGDSPWMNNLRIMFTAEVNKELWGDDDFSASGFGDITFEEESLGDLSQGKFPLVYEAYSAVEKLQDVMRSFMEELAASLDQKDHTLFTSGRKFLHFTDDQLEKYIAQEQLRATQ